MSVVAKIGHNQPPEPTPFEASKEAIEGLFEEAKCWLDGEPIANQAQADDLQKLMRMIQAAAKEADERRKEEARPFDDGKAEVQARYNPLIQKDKGLADLAISACKKALAPWLIKVDEDNRRIAAAARAAAEEKQRIAMEAMRERDGDLGKAVLAEALVEEAKKAESDARFAEKLKASAKGEGRAVTLRDYFTAEVTDYTAFARHAWAAHRSDMREFLDGLAKRIVDAGVHSGTPGVTVHHERRAQ